MENKLEYIKVKDLAEELDVTVSNLNIQIGKGHAGEVLKTGDGETNDYLLTLDNVNKLLKWSRSYGRSNKALLMKAVRKYRELAEENE